MADNIDARFPNFADEDTRYDYDKTIAATRDMLKTADDHCNRVLLYDGLVKYLEDTIPQYNPRPCIEGLCFGLMIPHRSRIRRRLDSLRPLQNFERNKCFLKQSNNNHHHHHHHHHHNKS
eukprot:TRINITY_DN16228_c0_g1_i1.p1 TRINITY_DN16228_c0_g1~~TRINITY_DN16228_c0_g1_i1.p1  ORF type:complete len:120 (+),score=16.02 TRINITY_DN16228_c0_g1_i1:174-533(+)